VRFRTRIRPANFARTSGESQVRDPHQGFRQLVLPHLDSAYNLACYLTRDPVLSEDVIQDAFIRAMNAFPQFRGGSARAWLLTIVRNCCHTAMATRRREGGRLVYENGWTGTDLDAV
jgi:RNA polymerase sigma-70 factor (ECF subfamily)